MSMNRNFTMGLGLVPALCAMGTGASASTPARPNILFIFVDDLRPELGCYDTPQVKSPNLDRLAAEGLRFDRAYCQVPVCGASRASLLTGVLPTRTRFRKFDTRADHDAPWAETLPQTFKKAGYTTISNGKVFHHRDDAEARSWSEPAWRPKAGFRLSLDPTTTATLSARKRGRIYEGPDVPDNAYGDGQLAEKTIADLQRLKQAGGPFFLACGFVRPHLPFYAPKRYWDLYQRDEIQVADNRFRPKDAPPQLKGSSEFRSYYLDDFDENSVAFHRLMRHGYMASVSYVDKLVGDVLEKLERLDLADNTIVVVWGDHGWHLGEHNFWGKHNTMHLAMRVPLLIKVPGTSPGHTEALVETSDLFPTLCELADIPVPDTVQGRSFTKLLDTPAASFRTVAYSRYGNGDAVITQGFTYTSYNGGRSEMLYDLEEDPDENVNVAADPEEAETVAKMRALLKQREDEAARAGKTRPVAVEPRNPTATPRDGE